MTRYREANRGHPLACQQEMLSIVGNCRGLTGRYLSAEAQRRSALGAAERSRLLARTGLVARRWSGAALRQTLGLALIRAGERLRGARPVGAPRPAPRATR